MTEGAGAIEDGVHVMGVRVYYEDTDAAGIVYYANYLRYAERARTELLRHMGIESSSMMADLGLAFAVKRCVMDFVKPAKLDDLLTIESRPLDVGGASLEIDQRVRRDGADLVRMELKLACMSLDGRPARLPGDIRERLENFGA
ncbi:MAG: tol-pal system-associated acyl-CoA thioesterase [Alphaproteobacteria bacterium]|jgi:acyl-CoA thioester hydrolase|nr:tol-pal system-associated acyl-CoA thioesterase [Alphaproteobacteria bacterium]